MLLRDHCISVMKTHKSELGEYNECLVLETSVDPSESKFLTDRDVRTELKLEHDGCFLTDFLRTIVLHYL